MSGSVDRLRHHRVCSQIRPSSDPAKHGKGVQVHPDTLPTFDHRKRPGFNIPMPKASMVSLKTSDSRSNRLPRFLEGVRPEVGPRERCEPVGPFSPDAEGVEGF